MRQRQHYALYGLMCIYGIELLGDNIAEWGYLGKGKFQRRDFRFDVLTGSSKNIARKVHCLPIWASEKFLHPSKPTCP